VPRQTLTDGMLAYETLKNGLLDHETIMRDL
jgi:hypothetical protein